MSCERDLPGTSGFLQQHKLALQQEQLASDVWDFLNLPLPSLKESTFLLEGSQNASKSQNLPRKDDWNGRETPVHVVQLV